jgi:hypothetical protein
VQADVLLLPQLLCGWMASLCNNLPIYHLSICLEKKTKQNPKKGYVHNELN